MTDTKKMIIRPLCTTASVAGIILVLGAAGGSDLGTVPLSRVLVQSLVGLALVGGGIAVRMLLCLDKDGKDGAE